MSKEIGAYLLYNERLGVGYVGSGQISARENEHFTRLAKGTHVNKKLQRAYNQDSNFEFYSVPMETREEAFDFEQAVIDEYRGNPAFLNISTNARSCAVEITEETRAKMSKASLGRNVGMKRSPEVVEAMRQRLLGTVQSDETVRKRSESLRGRQMPEHVKEILKETWTGRKHTEEAKERMSVAAKERPYSPDKISKMNKAVSKQISVDGVDYPSASAAARAHGIDPSTALDRVRSTNARFTNWCLKEKEE